MDGRVEQGVSAERERGECALCSGDDVILTLLLCAVPIVSLVDSLVEGRERESHSSSKLAEMAIHLTDII